MMSERTETELRGNLKRWGFIGGGRMATALIQGMIRAGVATPETITASDPLPTARETLERETKVSVHESSDPVVNGSDILVLAVKPQSMSTVLSMLRPMLGPRHLVISVAAGTTLATLASGLGAGVRLVRVMPNTPALIGQGASAYAMGPGCDASDEAIVKSCLDSVGRAVRVPEALLDAVTGLSGSGPAFVYMMVEALSDGGVRMGLPRDVATMLATQTVIGAAMMVRETGLHPGELKDQVASPGGTTIAGIHALERGGLRAALMDAVEAATRRSTELSSASVPRPPVPVPVPGAGSGQGEPRQ